MEPEMSLEQIRALISGQRKNMPLITPLGTPAVLR